ncbi:MAG: DUF192 domain-containing protein [Deltaproteobacteria bacterium]|nr:DUF192 domain-containing protein [Deltaproteobacteria bacterium]
MKRFLWIFPCLLLAAACQKVEKAQEETGIAPEGEGSAEVLKQEETPEGAASLSVANVVLRPSAGDPVTLTVEIARTPEERAQGLQGRENLPDDHGMWFVFAEDGQDPFWMHNTPISLDILFVDAAYKIVDIVADATPNSEDLIVSRHPYRFALELAAGVSARHGLHAGDAVEFRLGPP